MRSPTILVGALATLALAGSAWAQATNGTVNFCNNRSNQVFFLQNNYPVAAGNGIKAALYWAPVGSGNFVMLGASAPIGVPVPGVFAGGTRVAGPATPGGAAGQFQVRAWGGPYTSYEQAFTNGGYCSGVSTVITMPTGNPTHVAPLPPASLIAGGFQRFGLGQSPIIIVPPANQVVGIGHTAVLTVTATGTAPLSYQWQFNGTNLTDNAHISGSLSTALTILNAQTSDAGTYRVIVTNLYGVTVSAAATLTVVQACVPPPGGLIGWWKGDGNGIDSAAGNNAYSTPNISYTAGVVGQAFACNQSVNPAVNIADIPAYYLTNALSIEAWVRPRGNGSYIFFRGDNRAGNDPYAMAMGGNNIVYFGITDTNGNSDSVSATISYNTWWHVVGTFDANARLMCIYTNGILASQIATARTPIGALIPGDHPGIGIGNVNDRNYYAPFVGDIDEVSLYNRALTAAEIKDLYNGSTAGKCMASPPVITLPPTNQVVVAGSNAVFYVLASGSPRLSYQWLVNGTNLLAATNTTLNINNAQVTNAGSYQVIITNAYGSATSPVATLTLALPPQITVQPTNQAVLVGSNAAFTVSATGTPPLCYRWWFNGTNALAATNATLSISNAQLTNAGSYYVVVTNNYGRATSVVAYLSVALPPRFQSITVRAGTLVMTWNGATGFTYQVQYKTNLVQLYWSNLNSPIFATGNVVTAYDVISSDRQRFYRVALLP